MKEKVVAHVYRMFATTYTYTVCNIWKKFLQLIEHLKFACSLNRYHSFLLQFLNSHSHLSKLIKIKSLC